MIDQTKPITTASPQAADVVMQMVMGAWVSQAISTLTRLDIPDRLKEHGHQSVQELTQNLGVDAKPEFLERVLRACSSIGLFSERAEGRFDITPLSNVLTSDSPVSLKKLTEVFGDSQCIQILKNCRQSMMGDGRLLCADSQCRLLPSGSDADAIEPSLEIDSERFGSISK